MNEMTDEEKLEIVRCYAKWVRGLATCLMISVFVNVVLSFKLW